MLRCFCALAAEVCCILKMVPLQFFAFLHVWMCSRGHMHDALASIPFLCAGFCVDVSPWAYFDADVLTAKNGAGVYMERQQM